MQLALKKQLYFQQKQKTNKNKPVCQAWPWGEVVELTIDYTHIIARSSLFIMGWSSYLHYKDLVVDNQ